MRGGIEQIVNMICGFAEDMSWRLGCIVADQLAYLSDDLGPAAAIVAGLRVHAQGL